MMNSYLNIKIPEKSTLMSHNKTSRTDLNAKDFKKIFNSIKTNKDGIKDCTKDDKEDVDNKLPEDLLIIINMMEQLMAQLMEQSTSTNQDNIKLDSNDDESYLIDMLTGDAEKYVQQLVQVLEDVEINDSLARSEEDFIIAKLQQFVDEMDNVLKQSESLQHTNEYFIQYEEVDIAGKNNIQKIVEVKEEIEEIISTFNMDKTSLKPINNERLLTDNTIIKQKINIKNMKQVQQNEIDIEETEGLMYVTSMLEQPDQEQQKETMEQGFANKIKIIDLKSKKTDAKSEEAPQFNEVIELGSDKVINFKQVKSVTSGIFSEQNVVKQLVESAKILLTEDKSEMLLQLKPESLGKLTLRVVSERGMLVAKIIAESQQVKEIIESNFSQLKDTLQEQGLNIQGLSVSIQNGDAGKREFEKLKNIQNKIKLAIEPEEDVNTAYEFKGGMVNPYDINQSSIDFTA